ncbi:MAG: HPr family phosphocarrier protein [Christensenellales bacterium]
MKSVSVLLNTTDNVKSFVELLTKYDYEMDLRSGRYVVDAKSILGIFSLDLNKPVVLEIYADECDELLQNLKPYIN